MGAQRGQQPDEVYALRARPCSRRLAIAFHCFSSTIFIVRVSNASREGDRSRLRARERVHGEICHLRRWGKGSGQKRGFQPEGSFPRDWRVSAGKGRRDGKGEGEGSGGEGKKKKKLGVKRLRNGRGMEK